MGLLLGIILPFLLIMLPVIILIAIGRKKNKIGRVKFGLAILGCSLLGFVVPILATYLSAKGLMYNFGPDDPKCVIGAGVFLFGGYLINVIGLPITGIALFPSKH
ncbi:hypothetical protein [Pontibacter litorisediminis]|uniref:hypothetical protein n=1 Tax=Pontibacter litorisediminis TaxID=1846260 RepID=UPI0023EAE3A2|nr:hypothetical protein [Pontibacter litorisediminis]